MNVLSMTKKAPLWGCPPPARLVYDTIKKPPEFLPKLFTMSVGVCIIELSAINH
jgi:hypothetical protein